MKHKVKIIKYNEYDLITQYKRIKISNVMTIICIDIKYIIKSRFRKRLRFFHKNDKNSENNV